MATSGGSGNYNTIKVVARFRPQNKTELASDGEPIVAFETGDTCNLNSKEAAGSFTFDRVFDMNSRQSDVFDFSIRNTVDDILNGYNGTVFAYGQTGSGKSYTMMGPNIDDDDSRGIIPRIVDQIFTNILASPGNIEYTVRVSYMEIYMERIRDLLAPMNDNLPIHEEKNRGVYVKGLLEVYVSSIQEVYEVMRRGGNARAVAATNMNQESSRSHSIFVVTITQKNVETGSAKSGQLFLVDLAGSEKVGKTGASGQTLEEAKKINKSLSALGMVINSLTDGKSTHIPYRDSKLTRILQESLGGNSRTTLIINCSPSSYNDSETLSTLKFGMRAKAIKNKAKINAELSPTELKALLRKAQNQVTTFENYLSTLEGEVQLWRSGESVPKERWAPSLGSDILATRRADARVPGPSTPSRLQSDSVRSETPSRSESRMADRASTPSVSLDKDEREEYLRRENELQDQVAEKESQIAQVDKALRGVREELSFLKEQDSRTGQDNERLSVEVNELKMYHEKVSFESKEAQITLDAVKEANSELTSELDEVKQQLLSVRMSTRETSAGLDEKEKKKHERMAEMMAGFDLGDDVTSANEKAIRQVIEQVDSLQEASAAGGIIDPADFQDLRRRLMETCSIVQEVELQSTQSNGMVGRRGELEQRLLAIEREYEALLERNLSDTDIEEVKDRLAKAYSDKREMETEMVDQLREDIAQKADENGRLRTAMAELERKAKSGAIQPNGSAMANGGKTVQQQIAEFDVMKKSLMRDLQNRCERVVELEISLDETREQYNNVLRSSNNRAQAKKMAFLERNLEQLTLVQRQLVEQNGSLKKEVAIAERKLIARNERIMSLESLLGDSQEKLTSANHRFEAQLTAVKERLEAAKISSSRVPGMIGGSSSGYGPSTPSTASFAQIGGFSFGGGGGSRIAKPLRGGGGGGDTNGSVGPPSSVISGLRSTADDDGSPGSKRMSWFNNLRG